MPSGTIALLALLLLLLLWPLIFIDIMALALAKLGIPVPVGVFIVIGIFVGGFINLPVKRYPVKQQVSVDQLLFGMHRWLPAQRLVRSEQVIAVNLGGCLIPLGVVVYLLIQLAWSGDVLFLLLAVLINIAVCFAFSRAQAGVGILMPVLLPGLTAALSGLLLYPQNPPAAAFCAGILGPLIGADLLRLRQIRNLGVGIASIGGAGTFDGIVISGFIALLLS